ncbi:MAG: DUF2807 domain-containing protein [Pseudomonadota bacterium]|nr:DUF2807 domain-containing protein [Pseudomonadota bacterium]
MIRATLAFASLVAIAAPAAAADRTFTFGSYERVRVEGPFEVSIDTGASPGVSASGDQRALDRLDIVMQGSTLVVRIGDQGWGETPVGKALAPPHITLRTPTLAGVYVNAGARVTVSALRAQRADLSVNGSGLLTVGAIDADELYASVIGAGSATLSGIARRARIVASGAATIDASGLVVNDLTLQRDGTGDTRATARYTAQISANGLGHVVVGGAAKCTVHASAATLVECGTPAP